MKTGITGGFWKRHQENALNNVIPYQWKALNDEVEGAVPSGCLHNFRVAAGVEQGEHMGFVFQDSDLAKFVEAAAYSLSIRPDSKLESDIDGLIDIMETAQEESGYLNTAFMLKDRDKRFTNLRDDHELYVAGHFLEAAVAYKRVTGKDKLLNILSRNIDHIMTVIGPEEGKLHGYPGHEELELALCKVYELTGQQKYLDFAKYLIDERGSQPNFFVNEAAKRGQEYSDYFDFYRMAYYQAHKPVREQNVAAGHSVRAGYLYSGMADVARLTDDKDLLAACSALFDNIVEKQMYITGNIGQSAEGEAFSVDYDLPNDTVYGETCASISLIFFAKRMMQIYKDAKYTDVMETVLYNGALSGLSLDGTKYFYVNPLEVNLNTAKGNPQYNHVKTQRQEWFGCACCPPNIARLLASMQDYIYTRTDECTYVDLFVNSVSDMEGIGIKQTTDYPNSGKVRLDISGGSIKLALRKPGWCDDYNITVNGKPVSSEPIHGYIHIGGVVDGDVIEIDMDIQPTYYTAHGNISQDAGKAALKFGPLVYCMEGIDNGENLHNLYVDPKAKVVVSYEYNLLGGVNLLTAKGYRQEKPQQSLYQKYSDAVCEDVYIKFIPYYAWANRGEYDMSVWVKVK